MVSPIWKYFVKVSPLEAKCNFCGTLLKTGGGTTNVRSHLKNKHKEEFLAIQAKCEGQESEIETSPIASTFVTDSSGTIITDVVVLEDKSEVDTSAKKTPKAKRKKRPATPLSTVAHSWNDRDRYEAFATTVALRLRDISDKNQRLIAEKVINDILFSAEMGQLAYNNDANVTHPSIVSYISSFNETS